MVVGGCLESANWSSNHPREFGVLLRIDLSHVNYVLALLVNEGSTAFLEEWQTTKKVVISMQMKKGRKMKGEETDHSDVRIILHKVPDDSHLVVQVVSPNIAHLEPLIHDA